MTHYILFASCVFSVLSTIWQKHTLYNLCIKLFLLGSAIWGWYLILHGVV